MKKKPELFKRTGKSSLTLRNFLNNLKENDLHYENKQITQCVFLGVLRLKPVPSIFTSNNVPSVSAQVCENAAKTVKNDGKSSSSNKKLKNVPNKNDINKVLSGKVTKRNPQKVKAAVKKVPIKKSNIIKIKLNTKKNVDKNTISSPKNIEASELPTDSSGIAPHTFLSAPTLSLTPIVSSTKFNPVQNLFDKLKQKIDENNSEPGSSKVKKQLNKSRESLESNITNSKVCKINAKRSVKIVSIKKSKQVLLKKPGIHMKSSSPITISDNESTSRRDEDDVTIITDESNCSSSFNQEVAEHTEDATTEDVIFVNQETKQKSKSRTSPRNKLVNDTEVTEKQTNNTPNTTKVTSQPSEIIIISDELAVNEKHNTLSSSEIISENTNEEKKHFTDEENSSKNDVIVIDEVREVRVSPRFKKAEGIKEKSKNEEKLYKQGPQTEISDIIVITEETTMPKIINVPSSDEAQNISAEASSSNTYTQELNITIDNEQNLTNKSKTSPKLLQLVDKNYKMSVTIKKELMESTNDEQDVIVINEKPRQRKSKPTLLPPALLTPMLLRSELAQKKLSSTVQNKSRTTRMGDKSHSRLLRSNIEQTKSIQNQSKKNTKTKSSTRLLRSELENAHSSVSSTYTSSLAEESLESAIDVPTVDKVKTTKSSDNPLERSRETKDKDLESVESYCSDVPQVAVDLPPETNTYNKVALKNEVIVGDEQTSPNRKSTVPKKSDLPLQKAELSHIDVEKNEKTYKLKEEDVVVIKEEKKLNVTVSPRLLRSDLAKQRSLENSPSSDKEDLNMSIKNEKEVAVVEKVSPQLSTSAQQLLDNSESTDSELNKSKRNSKKSAKQTDEEVILIKEESTPKENASSRSLRSDLNQQKKRDSSKKNNTRHVEEIIVINENPTVPGKEKVSPRLRSEVDQQNKLKSQKIDRINLDEIIVVDDPTATKSRNKSNGRLLRSELAQRNSKEKSPEVDAEKVVVLIHDEPKSKEKHPCTLQAQQSQLESEANTGMKEQVIQSKNKINEKSPLKSKMDKIQKQSPENVTSELEVSSVKDDFTREKPKVVKHTTCSRLLRSEIVPQHTENLTIEAKSDKSQELEVEKVTSSPRVLRSDTVSCQHTSMSQDQPRNSSKASIETSEKQSSSPRSRRVETTSPRKARDLSKEMYETIEIIEDENGEQTTSPRMLRSEITQQNKSQNPPKNYVPEGADNTKGETRISSRKNHNTPKEPSENNEVIFIKTKERPYYGRRRSLLMDLKVKQKTRMLLRSELAQMKSGGADGNPTVENEHQSFHDTREKNVTSIEETSEVPATMITVTFDDENVKTDGVSVPKRKSLIDDLKRKKAAKEKECTVSTPQNNQNVITEPPESSTDDLKAAGHDVQDANGKITHDSTSEPKMDSGSVKLKRSPRSTKLSNDGNQKDLTGDAAICLPSTSEEIGIDSTENKPLRHSLSPTRRPKESHNCEGNKSPNKTEIEIKVSANDIDSDSNKNILHEKSSSPKRKSKEDRTETPEIIQNNNLDISPKESKLSTRRKSSPKEKCLSPKRKMKETKLIQENEILEVPGESSESDKNNKMPRKQKSALSKKKLKGAKHHEDNVNPEGIILDSSPPVLPTETLKLEIIDVSPKRKNSSVKRKSKEKSSDLPQTDELKLETIDVSPNRKRVSPKTKVKDTKCPKVANTPGKPKEKLSERTTTETGVDNIIPPNKCSARQKSLTRRKKVIEGNSPSESDGVSAKSPDVLKVEVKEQISTSKRGRKPKKTKTAAKNLTKTIPKPSIDEIKSTQCASEPEQKNKTLTKKKAKQTKRSEDHEAVEELPQVEIVDNTVVLSSGEGKAKGKKRKASPTKRKLKEVKSREEIIDLEDLPDVEDDVAKEVKSETNDSKQQTTKRKGKSLPKNAKKKSQSRKSGKHDVNVESPSQVENVVEQSSTDNSSKKIDTTVFDFDESEPEFVPLRLSNTPRKNKVSKPTVEASKEVGLTPGAKRQKLSESNSKTKAKAKLLAMFGDKPQQTNGEIADGSQKKSVRNKKNEASNTSDTNESNANISPDKVTSPTKTSPLKQTTITHMFSKQMLFKKEQPPVTDIFDSVTRNDTSKEITAEKSTAQDAAEIMPSNMPPPKIERKSMPASKDEGENEYYDDDSDCESRMEWIPEEYAEYKFKYSAKKMMSYKPIHKCKICLLILPSYYRLSKHKLEHARKENPYNCTQCDQVFPNIDDLTAHLRLHKGKHPYTCKKCDIGFWSKKALDGHTPIHVLRKVKQPNKRFRCDVCAKEFSKLCDMERHTRVHTGEKPCVCNICNKRFQQSHNLSKHLLTHLHVKPYHCEICNKQFGRNDVLNRHLLTHSVDKPIKCSHCQKGFIRQSQLNNHVKKYHQDGVKLEASEESKTVQTNN